MSEDITIKRAVFVVGDRVAIPVAATHWLCTSCQALTPIAEEPDCGCRAQLLAVVPNESEGSNG